MDGSGGTETVTLTPQRTVKEIRIDLERRGLQSEYAGFSLREVEIYGPGTDNLAIGATATAFSWQDSYGCYECFPGKAIDGDMNSRWSTQLYEPRQWFEITLPTPQVVDRIVLIWEDAYAEEYSVRVRGIDATPTPVWSSSQVCPLVTRTPPPDTLVTCYLFDTPQPPPFDPHIAACASATMLKVGESVTIHWQPGTTGLGLSGGVSIRDNDEEHFETLATIAYGDAPPSSFRDVSQVLELVDVRAREREMELRAIAPGTTEVVFHFTGQLCSRNWSGGPAIVMGMQSDPLRITVVDP